MNSRDKISAKINNWFHHFDDDTTPAITICEIAFLFEERLKGRDLELAISFRDFRNSLCEATCTMYKARLEDKRIRGPSKIGKVPKNWNQDIELIWEDYISMFFLHDDFWSDFWSRIPVGFWEGRFPEFRIFIQSLLPMYIQRDYERLEDNNLIKQNNDGEYIDINEYDEEDDRGYDTN